MLFWSLAVSTWLIVATLGHMYFIPFSMRFDWDRGMTRVGVALWPIGLPCAAAGITIYYTIFFLDWIYKKTWGRLADTRLQKIQEEKNRIAREFFLKKEAEREAEELARKEARKAAQAKDQNEPQPVFRERPRPIKCCASCHCSEDYWRKVPYSYITDDERLAKNIALIEAEKKEYEAEREAESEEESPSRHVGESVIC